MAYTLTYWEQGRDSQTHYELKSIRLKSINEAYPLALQHNRPSKTVLITVERHRNYKGKKWIDEKTIWEPACGNNPINIVVRPQRTK